VQIVWLELLERWIARPFFLALARLSPPAIRAIINAET
jgi:hypothetical protein